MYNYYKKYIKYKSKYLNFQQYGGVNGGVNLPELFISKINNHNTYTLTPLFLWCKHPYLDDVYCFFEKIADSTELNRMHYDKQIVFNSNNTINDADSNIMFDLKNQLRWMPHFWFSRMRSPYDLTKYFGTNHNIYMAYLYKIDKINIKKFITDSDFNIKNIIIQVMVFINIDKEYAIHFYINTNKYKDLGHNVGKNIFDSATGKSLYPNQSMCLHAFSAYIIQHIYPSIKYIWSSPSLNMFDIMKNFFIKVLENSGRNIDDVILNNKFYSKNEVIKQGLHTIGGKDICIDINDLSILFNQDLIKYI